MTHDDLGGAEPGRCPVPHDELAFARSAPDGEWLASRYADVQAVLSDERFEVPAAEPDEAVGTIRWLRASVSRFVNGAEHEERRATVVQELSRFDPAELRSAVERRARAVLAAVGRPGERFDVMEHLARRAPMATLAAALGVADPELAATAVMATAAAYFPGADVETRRRADAATATLVEELRPAEMDQIVARIQLMVQGCDAVAGLIGTALHMLQDATEPAGDTSTDALLTEVLRHSPPGRSSRRVARTPVDFDGLRVSAGDTVVCSIDAANRDPAVFERPDCFDPARPAHSDLSFGYGVRPCPAAPHAVMLAAGVVDAVRGCCRLLVREPVTYEPSAALRIPRHLWVLSEP
jgi:cytochrome P450